MENNFPQRKHPRLDHYDYSSCGAYFVTICTHQKRCLLSRVEEENGTVEYTPYGNAADRQIALLEERYPFLNVKRYVIMPNHIHMILVLDDEGEEKEDLKRRPSLTDMICSYKSLTVRDCKREGYTEKLFQTSFYEHVIRNRDEYTKIDNYVRENPRRWGVDELHIV